MFATSHHYAVLIKYKDTILQLQSVVIQGRELSPVTDIHNISYNSMADVAYSVTKFPYATMELLTKNL
jgi:hypothetical protein